MVIMKRKVNKVGQNTLTVSLPTKWAKENSINPGDELNYQIEGEQILFYINQLKTQKKSTTLNISNFDRKLLVRYLESMYINGYNKIKLNYDNDIEDNYRSGKKESRRKRIKQLVNRYIGMEIISQTPSSTEIHCFLHDKEDDLEKIELRIINLIKDVLNEITFNLDKGNYDFLEQVYDQHDNISRFISYYLRVLSNSDKNIAQKQQLYSLYINVDRIVDNLTRFADIVSHTRITKKSKNLSYEFFEFLRKELYCLQKKKITTETIKLRYEIERKIEKGKLTENEVKLLMPILPILDLMKDIMRAIVCYELES